jgi:proline dehydrogenase
MMRAILLKLAQSPGLARWVTSHRTPRRMARRFVAGDTLDQAVAAARICNQNGMKVSLDLLGESVRDAAAARRARDAYLAVFDRIAAENLDANVSLKLTQLGLDLHPSAPSSLAQHQQTQTGQSTSCASAPNQQSAPEAGEGLCRELLQSIVARAAQYKNFARVDMEGSAYTERTLELVRQVRAESPAIGVVVQAYLRRTEADVPRLLAHGCRLRLCKGAYQEPPEIAFPKKAEVNANFVRLMQQLLPSGIYHGIATHDPKMIAATKEFVAERGISKEAFEFQMLYGIRSDLQRELVSQGYRMRVYIPFGSDWFPYFMRRLAERPANVLFFVKNLFR